MPSDLILVATPVKLREVQNLAIGRLLSLPTGQLVFCFGKQLAFPGGDPPYQDWEYRLCVDGDWVYRQDSRVVASNEPNPPESLRIYAQRIRVFVNSLHPEKIIGVSISDDFKSGTFTFSNGDELLVTDYKNRFLSLVHDRLDVTGHRLRISRFSKFVSGQSYREDSLVKV